MAYTIEEIVSIVAGRIIASSENGEPLYIQKLSVDSRRIIFPGVSLFFAISGDRRDGHDFIRDAFDRGVRAFIISDAEKIRLLDLPSACVALVGDTVEALQKLAAHHRRRFPVLKVAGVTGSNGKTVVKEWLFQLLNAAGKSVVRSPKSYNSQIGVPLSVWEIDGSEEWGIFEAGISTTGEMEKLTPVIDCQYGIFTMLGDAHAAGFAGQEQKLKEKLRLFKHTPTIFYCKDDPLVHRVISEQYAHRRLVCWSSSENADLKVENIHSEGTRTRIETIFRDQKLAPLIIPFTDAASVQNAILCRLFMLDVFGASSDPAMFEKLEPVAMRLELKTGVRGCLIVNDAYNSDLTSLTIALDFARCQSAGKPLAVILSDVLQSGVQPITLYAEIGRLLVEKGVDRIVGIGLQIPVLKNYLPDYVRQSYYPDTERLLSAINRGETFSNEIVLLKGARAFTFERLAERLSFKNHTAALEINLTALTHNLQVFKKLILPGVKMMVMVKASAYGNGADEIARLLEFQKVDYLSVAYSDEGAQLREAGVRLPIMVLNPEAAAFDKMVQYDLEPEIYSVGLLRRWLDFDGRSPSHKIHLKLDTGMRRLGFEAGDLAALLPLLSKELKVASIFSHQAASEAPEHDVFTRFQAASFMEMYEPIANALGYRPLRHILNSGGIARFPEFQFDMVRLGIGLYGIAAHAKASTPLVAALAFKAAISQIKLVKTGETVGYGRRWTAKTHTRIATISAGYADGLPRAAGNERFSVGLHGKRVPIVGNVCMDMCMIDLTDVPEAVEGEEVEIFGLRVPVQELATACETIPYEIFTGVSERVKRVYFEE